VFKPKRLGELSKDNGGGHRNVLVPFKDPNFKRSDIDEIMKLAKHASSGKPPLPPSASAPQLKKVDETESISTARKKKAA
jgi:hypothetical protein